MQAFGHFFLQGMNDKTKNPDLQFLACTDIEYQYSKEPTNTYYFSPFFEVEQKSETNHTTYSWNIKWQKWVGISGLCVLNEIIQKKYPENMKKIVGAVWKLPTK